MSNPLSRRNPALMSDKTKAWLRKHNKGFAETYRTFGIERERSVTEAARIWDATPPELRRDPDADAMAQRAGGAA